MARISHPNKLPVWRLGLRYAAIFLIAAIVLFGYQTVTLYTDWLWFGELGRRDVFSAVLKAKLLLYFGFGLLFFLIFYFNLWLAQRLNADRGHPRLLDIDREEFGRALQRSVRWLALGVAIFLAFMIASNAVTHWSDYLLFTHAGSFGQTDPLFHRDIAFYMFRLPFLGFLQSWFLIVLGLTIVGTAAVHYSANAIEAVNGGVPSFSEPARKHLLALAGFFALIYAVGYVLGRYDLLYSNNAVFYGAGYTDVHAHLPAMNIQAFLMALIGILCFVNIWQGRPFRLPLAGLAVFVVVSILMAGVYPAMLERFTVEPNQVAAERTYIQRNIQATQKAYGLDRVRIRDYPGTAVLTAHGVADNSATIDNVRLWDWPQLGAVYTNKQRLRPYYRFTLPASATTDVSAFNIDVDRYRIGNDYRQVMLAPRELDSNALPADAQTWVNQKLQYTHGYGVVVSPVNRKDSSGLPEYLVSQIPVESTAPELTITRPQVYYGEVEGDYVFVDTKQDEFDYPGPDGDKFTRYTGKGGVPLGGQINRLAWSIRLGDANMLLSKDLSDRSRILFRRNIRERVEKIAPFLNWDNDPYLVVDGGRLYWIRDGYTASDHYPYSKPTSVGTGVEGVTQDFNYIRNSVKVVVDAYDGTVTFYAADPNDPVLRTWSHIFPSLFVSLDRMPASLRAHVRYPEDLFRIQRDIYQNYHMSDPRVFYQKEDAWSVPGDPTPPADAQGNPTAQAGEMPMMPYYVVMRVPDGTSEEFLMMSPFTPRNNSNITAWMCAKCDAPNYGQIEVYRFPRGANVNGPLQIKAQIDSRPEISQRATLLGQRGSKVIFGNLLAIPVNSSLLYAVPLYVQSSAMPIPELDNVVVANGDRIVMRPTLDEAMSALVAGGGPATPPALAGPSPTAPAPSPASATTAKPGAPASVTDLLNRANSAYQKAKQKQQEYNSSLDELGQALQDLQRKLGK